MSIVNQKYRRLYAQEKYLTDEVVLIQAWKKSQRYIRNRNWYADFLELDQSAVLLEHWVKGWIKDLDTGCALPKPMRMVPAPKTHRWGFEKELWLPIEREDGEEHTKAIHLRPLAHLGIREQTMASAAMLCLADCIETAQGDPSITDYFEARRRGIHSYGNRLYCTVDPDAIADYNHPKPLAQFNWGNSETYRRYYKDYKKFLDRPRIIAANVQDQLGNDEELFVIKLDISAFFDRIHRPTLINRLQDEYAAFVNSYTLTDGNADDKFWNCLEQIFSWEWNSEDHMLKRFLKEQAIPDGLPQGLVASGFFANAYLLEFDRCISGMLKKHLGYEEVEKTVKSIRSTSGWNRELDFATLLFEWKCDMEVPSGLPDLPHITIHDYCRYVDDIRLVVSVKGDVETRSPRNIKITPWMNAWLNVTANPRLGVSDYHCLELNSGKTEMIPFRLMDGQIGITSRMSLIQNELSGPADMETLQQTTAGLDALLSRTEQFDCCLPLGDEAHPLSTIASPKTEIRDDTLKRFAAYRLLKTLRLRRSMTDLDSEIGPGLKARDAIDHEIEMFARKLIRAWTHDPSLTLVLRYGMDLFPSPELLRPVLDGLRQLIEESTGESFTMVGWYICADLLRAGAMETGFQTRDLEMPDVADLASYRVLLIDFAREILDPQKKLGKKSPWYVQQQALLLLAVLEPCPALVSIKITSEIQPYLDLLQAAAYTKSSVLQQNDLVLAMVFQQLHLDAYRFAKWLVDSLQASTPNDPLQYLKLVSYNRPDLMKELINEIDARQLKWIHDEDGYLKPPKGMHNKARDMTDFDGETIVLWNVVSHTDNPFGQEIQWLKLAHEMIKTIQKLGDDESTRKLFSLHNIIITVKSWQRLKQPELGAGKLIIQFNSSGQQDPRLETPDWCVDGKQWFYVIGRLLRSAITGEQDFTLTPYLNRQELECYSGMRNSWYTRRMGMIHMPESLSGEAAPFSP
ncbi:MAG: RNA-directed DNA polymerase, partial [Magnetococcales bacterium]|nr:RNA-directed DNA polymerase [Magnetococcales bacterium]